MDVGITINTNSMLKTITDGLSNYTRSLITLQSKALTNAGEMVLIKDALESFHNEGAIEGLPKWDELSNVTLRKRTHGGDVILQDSGKLRNSIQILNVDNDKVIVGSQLSYAALHQYGGTTVINGRRVLVPKRPFLQSFNESIVSNTFKRILKVFINTFRRGTNG